MPTGRIVICDVRPSTKSGTHPAKAVVGEALRVSADVFTDGHDVLAARALWRRSGAGHWETCPMADEGNDRFAGWVLAAEGGMHELIVEAWTDEHASWSGRTSAKLAAGQEVELEMEQGARLLEARLPGASPELRSGITAAAAALRDPALAASARLDAASAPAIVAAVPGPAGAPDRTQSRSHKVWVDRPRALYGAWYELFPRSEGGLAGTLQRLGAVAGMGFDVVYLPPVHPIGRTNRKGRDNSVVDSPGDPGSPWAIGSEAGGHTSIDPGLGTFADFEELVTQAASLELEIALDYALQCSADHPWLASHPEWFHHRPDGSIAYAENPPKRYQDIYPLNFWPAREADRRALWEACRDIMEFWIAKGVRVFRVDNPHTKPVAFWEWLIEDVRRRHDDVVLLAEAFTRPKMMAKLAEVGFSQSYTYFTWRNSSSELAEYLSELTTGPVSDYMRPNLWPNTPDILSGPLRRGPMSAFRARLLLATTLSPSYGIYSGYELGENEPASDDNEEYLHSEKYEVKHRDWSAGHSIAPWVARVNAIRRRHECFRWLKNLTFHSSPNPALLVYSKVYPLPAGPAGGPAPAGPAGADVVLVVVNLDPWVPQEAVLELNLEALGVRSDLPYEAYDELSGQSFTWYGNRPYVRLDPALEPGHVLWLKAQP
ncbi:MAG: alpha-1,4-glucan--maltose-1-phosphate maltosyltransferase [Acidimicrobiales bacterium]